MKSVPSTEGFELRHEDFSLSSEQEALRDTYRMFLDKYSTIDEIREAEPLGFDPELWMQLCKMAPIEMGLSEASGGDGAGIIELSIVAEEIGRHAAPIPLIEALVTSRLLQALGQAELLASARSGETIVSLALGHGDRQLVQGGAVASAVLARVGDSIVLKRGGPSAHTPNLASSPLGWWDFSDGIVIGDASEFGRAVLEWRVLTASALVGLGQASLNEGVEYAKNRLAFGAPIGSFQAIAHPLADVAIGLTGSRRLVQKAAWFADFEPEHMGAQAPISLFHASEISERAGAVAIHTQGGFGFTLESSTQLFYRRSKGWGLAGGSRQSLLAEIGSILYASSTQAGAA
jgi:alkylation response protein AidB-like acyl-CoA dehydrogenase